MSMGSKITGRECPLCGESNKILFQAVVNGHWTGFCYWCGQKIALNRLREQGTVSIEDLRKVKSGAWQDLDEVLCR